MIGWSARQIVEEDQRMTIAFYIAGLFCICLLPLILFYFAARQNIRLGWAGFIIGLAIASFPAIWIWLIADQPNTLDCGGAAGGAIMIVDIIFPVFVIALYLVGCLLISLVLWSQHKSVRD